MKKRYAATDLGKHVDFCAVARGFGVEAIKVSAKVDLREALKKVASLPGPVVVDVETDPDCYCFPMVPPGKKSTEAIFSPEDWQG
jgi:acetolactate synthase-1/2/3 large subunit